MGRERERAGESGSSLLVTMATARARSTGRYVCTVLDSYRNTLDRCVLQSKRDVSHCFASQKLGAKSKYFRQCSVETLRRKTTALQNQAEQLHMNHTLKEYLFSQQTQTLLFSSNGKTTDSSEKDLGTFTETVMMAALEKKLGNRFSRTPTLPASSPLLIVISGPSGVGKDAVIKRLQEVQRDMHFVVTATTRPRRKGEVRGAYRKKRAAGACPCVWGLQRHTEAASEESLRQGNRRGFEARRARSSHHQKTHSRVAVYIFGRGE